MVAGAKYRSPRAGDVNVTVGIALVATVIVAAADVETPPALSVAFAVIEYAPALTPLHTAL